MIAPSPCALSGVGSRVITRVGRWGHPKLPRYVCLSRMCRWSATDVHPPYGGAHVNHMIRSSRCAIGTGLRSQHGTNQTTPTRTPKTDGGKRVTHPKLSENPRPSSVSVSAAQPTLSIYSPHEYPSSNKPMLSHPRRLPAIVCVCMCVWQWVLDCWYPGKFELLHMGVPQRANQSILFGFPEGVRSIAQVRAVAPVCEEKASLK